MEKKYWFPAKPPECGWGWGLPLTWQGWVVFTTYFLLLIGGALLLAPQHPAFYLAGVFVLSALLVAICWITGEPPRHPFRREARR